MSLRTYDVLNFSANNIDTKENLLNSVIVQLKLTKEDIERVKKQNFNQPYDNSPMFNAIEPDNLNSIIKPYNSNDMLNRNLVESESDKTLYDELDLLLLENCLKSNSDHIKSNFECELMKAFTVMERWPKQVDINCWWCRTKFKTVPCAIPYKQEENTFEVYGCFCSFECSLAYLYDEKDYKQWEKIMLLKKLAMKMGHQLNLKKYAPSWKLLKEYGGTLTIEQFRSGILSNLNTDFHTFILKHKKNYLQISQNIASKPKSKEILEKRNKQKIFYVKNSNSKPKEKLSELEKSMGIKFS